MEPDRLDNHITFQSFKGLTDDERLYFIFDTLCRVDNRTAAFEAKYSQKWVEQTMKGLMAITLTGVVATILATIGIHIRPGA